LKTAAKLASVKAAIIPEQQAACMGWNGWRFCINGIRKKAMVQP
jgi:hypothetical protein